jgi:cellulose synthase (UDP-forming)
LRRDRLLGLSLATVNVSLYVYLVSHLNWVGMPALVLSALFFLTSTFFLTWNLGYAFSIHRRSRRLDSSQNSALGSFPSVSIIVPVYQENINVLGAMVEGFVKLDYPAGKLDLYVCDDTVDPAQRAAASKLCMDKGGDRVHYCTRSSRRGFKAGAINDILPRITSKYSIMLDVDHVPLPDMVRTLVSAKLNSQADFLMFPQYFRNEDENTVTVSSSMKQLVDYRIDRLGRCVTNSAFCVTTNWIVETESLRSLGGLDETTVTEDLATGLIAHSKGFKIDLIDEKLALGLAPNNLESWRRQQYRWSSGTFKVAKTIFPKAWPRLTWHQRMDYTLSISWYLCGIFTFFLYVFPIATALGVKFFRYGSLPEFLSLTLSLIALSWLLTSYPVYLESRSVKRTLIAQAASLALGDVYVRALISALRRKKQIFSVTRKDSIGRLKPGSALRSLRFHFFFVAIGAAVALHSMVTNQSLASMVNVGWIWYNNLWVIISALILGRN